MLKSPRGSRNRTDHSVDEEAVLSALHDEDCRELLAATTEDCLTAKELIGKCEIPKSTIYRKLDLLTDAGLLEECIRISTDGTHASEYCRAFEDITITVTDQQVAVGITTG